MAPYRINPRLGNAAMPFIINGELIADEPIRHEMQRLAQRPDWHPSRDEIENMMRLRQAAESSVIGQVLLRQAAEQDTRPLDADKVAQEIERQRALNGCRGAFDERPLRRQVEAHLRLERTVRDQIGEIPKPSPEDVRRFFDQERQNFCIAEKVHAAHIVKHINGAHSEAEARAAIQVALEEIERGEPFAVVADRHSDCKGNGGDLGTFQRGVMVEEFDNVVFSLKAGERSPIFRTPYGFHIAEVHAKIPAGLADFDDVREDIERVMNFAAQQQALQRAVEVLRARAAIRRISREEARELMPTGSR
jgi:peptidyl-prolyl cis-trans isomerase C